MLCTEKESVFHHVSILNQLISIFASITNEWLSKSVYIVSLLVNLLFLVFFKLL